MPISHKLILFFGVLMKSQCNIVWLTFFIGSVKTPFLASQKQLFSEQAVLCHSPLNENELF